MPLYGCEGFEERVLDPDDLHLVECQVGTWAGCVFINMDLDAPPLHGALHPVPELLDPLRIADMRVDWWQGIRLQCNWKLALEAFMEGWHVRGTHTQLTACRRRLPEPARPPAVVPERPPQPGEGSRQQEVGHGEEQARHGVAADPNATIVYLRMINEQLQTTC